MKNKLRFIMPRLAGATVLTGLAAVVITTIFKLLLGLTLLAGAITLIARSIGRRKLSAAGQYGMPGLGSGNDFSNGSAWGSPVHPGSGYATKKGTSIVPIN